MPSGKLVKCDCGGKLKQTFETLDLEEYQCEKCKLIYTLYHVVKKWPEGTKPGEERARFGNELS
jgi:hypothetical protein